MLSLVMKWAMRKVASNGWRVHGGAISQLQCARDNGGGGGLAEVQVRRSRGCNSLLEPGYYISIS